MKSWMVIGIIAAVAGIGLWLYSKYRKEQKVIAEAYGAVDVEAIIRERPAGVTVSEAMEGIATELVKTGLEEFGVNINPAVDVVARQAGMLESDIRTLARREMEGQDIEERMGFIADTYKIDEATLRDMITVSESLKSETYKRYAAEVAAGTYTKPYYTYQHEAIAESLTERRAEVEEFYDTRDRGETFLRWQRRTTGTTTTAEAPTRTPTRAEPEPEPERISVAGFFPS